MKHYVMTTAWKIYRKYKNLPFAFALKLAWRKAKMIWAMHTDNVNFSYIKIDGTIREARGTLQDSVLPTRNTVGSHTTSPDLLYYWDLDRNGWRACRLERLIMA